MRIIILLACSALAACAPSLKPEDDGTQPPRWPSTTRGEPDALGERAAIFLAAIWR